MNKISLPNYEELKRIVLINAEIPQILPSECKILSDRVFKKNGNRISETTFKRIYGFASSKFSPSLFTLNVLSKYCNYKSWDDFCQKQNKKNIPTQSIDITWQLLQHNANKITGFTLQTLKNKSGIPYDQTIQREFINDHFDEFIDSGCTGTLLSAPAGYGKTIALCQWIDKKIGFDTLNDSNDIVLLFSGNIIMSALVSGRDINDWMLALLGYNTDNDISALLDIKQRKEGKFYLIIDGLDEHMFKNDHFGIILNQLIDIFSFYKSHNWFKLILTTRSSTWINKRHEMEIGNNPWFTGFKNDVDCINVPLFSLGEINTLFNRITPGIENFLSVNVIENFNHPLYFQFYYQQYKESFSLSNINYICFYDTISSFIISKVYLGNYSTEKILLIKDLVEELDIKNNVYQVNKLKIINIIKKHNHAYQDLLSVGFIKEHNDNYSYMHDTYIVFGNNDFMEHSIAKILLYNNSNLLDADLIEEINNSFTNNTHKLNIIKWCIIHAIRSGQLKNIDCITAAQLSTNEKSELITFLGEVLQSEYSSTSRNESLIQYFKHSFSEKMFDYFFGLELINSEYKKFLHVLLKFDLSNKKKILIHATLAIIAVIQIDLNELEITLAKLKSFPKAEFETFSINPLNCLDAIYYHLKYGIIKTEALTDITKLYFTGSETLAGLKKSASNDILHLLGLYTLLLCNNPRKLLRFVSFLNKRYTNDVLDNDTSKYDFFIKVLTANAYFELGISDKVEQIYYSISADHKKSDDLLTPYMKIIFHGLKIKKLVNSSKVNLISNEMKIINNITAKSGYKFSKLYISALLLKSTILHSSDPELYKQINFDFNKIIKECGLNPKLFLQTL